MKKDDNIWKEKMHLLRSYNSEMDIELEWNRLEKKIDKSKRKNRVLLIFFFFGLITTILLLSDKGLKVNKNLLSKIENKASDSKNLIRKEVSKVNTKQKFFNTQSVNPNEPKKINKEVLSVTHEMKNSAIENMEYSKTTGIQILNDNSIDDNNLLALINEVEIKPMSFIPIKTFTIVETKSEDFNLSNYQIKEPIAVSKPNKKIWLDIGFGIGKHDNIYSNNPLNDYKISNLTILEKPLENIQLGFEVGKVLTKNIYITGGFSYSRFNERFKRTVEYYEPDILYNQLVETYTNSDGEVFNRYADITVDEKKSLSQTRYNNSQFVNLNLAIGYRLKLNVKSNIDLELGLAKNIYSTFKGYTLDENSELINLNKLIIRSPTIQYQSSINYSYLVNHNTSLLIGYNFNTFTMQYENYYNKKINNQALTLSFRKFIH